MKQILKLCRPTTLIYGMATRQLSPPIIYPMTIRLQDFISTLIKLENQWVYLIKTSENILCVLIYSKSDEENVTSLEIKKIIQEFYD